MVISQSAYVVNDVLEEPNIMNHIMYHLDEKDVANLMRSGGMFTKEPRFLDTYTLFMEEQRLFKRKNTFVKTMTKVLKDNNNDKYSIEEKRRNVDKMFKYILENKDLLLLKLFAKLKEAVYIKLLFFIQNKEDGFVDQALYYMSEIFGIYVQS